MGAMTDFLMGVLFVTLLGAAAFFFRFWRKTRDRFFALFAVAFLVLALNRIALFLTPEDQEPVGLYAVRLAAFVLILAAIWDKNRAD
jgi:phosphoglycerol transferase MdoB-like AlkP superfamily enzyme